MFDRKRYARLWRRRKYEKALAARSRGQATCSRRFGRFGACGGVLETDVQRDGSTVTTCPRCERLKAGLCLDCGCRVAGTVRRARRCAICTERERIAAQRRYKERHREAVNRRAKLAARVRMADPIERARRLAQKKAWRENNVVRVKLSKRKWRLQNRPGGWLTREKYEAYHRAYRLRRGLVLSPKETLMKGIERATKVLETAAAKTREKLAGVEVLQKELAAIERALGELRSIGAPDISPARRGRPPRAANA